MKVKILFVCMGNICRSPTAEGVFADLVKREKLHDRVHTDSAGTAAYHIGEAPDPRAQQHAAQRGVPIHHLRARAIAPEDYQNFDYILAMDRANLRHMQRECPAQHQSKLRLCLEFAPHLGVDEVPDPYYGGDEGFREVFDLTMAAAEGLLAHLRREHFSDGS